MKTLGLLGGMSWESTIPYYRIINETVRERVGGLHSAPIVLYSVDFHAIKRLQQAGDRAEAGHVLASAARVLEAAGADGLVLCTNTMHRVAPAIEAAVTLPLLHIADPTAAAIHRAGVTTVGLLGTRFTMEQDFYRRRLTDRHGLTVIVPAPVDRETVHRVIYEERCRGQVREDARAHYREIMQRLIEAGAEGLILGCTEIALLGGRTMRRCPCSTRPLSTPAQRWRGRWAMLGPRRRRRGDDDRRNLPIRNRGNHLLREASPGLNRSPRRKES